MYRQKILCNKFYFKLSKVHFVYQRRTKGGVKPPPIFRRPSKIVPNSTRLWKLLKIAEFRTPTPPRCPDKKGNKILKLPPVRNCFTLATTNKLVVIINSLKVPTIKKTLLYEIKFLVPNYSCLRNPWLGGYRPQIPFLSVLNWICWTPPEQNSWVRHWASTPLPHTTVNFALLHKRNVHKSPLISLFLFFKIFCQRETIKDSRAEMNFRFCTINTGFLKLPSKSTAPVLALLTAGTFPSKTRAQVWLTTRAEHKSFPLDFTHVPQKAFSAPTNTVTWPYSSITHISHLRTSLRWPPAKCAV